MAPINNSTGSAGGGGGGSGSMNSSSYIMAQRSGGVCHGTIWISGGSSSSTSSSSSSSSSLFGSGYVTSSSSSPPATAGISSSSSSSSLSERTYTYCILYAKCFVVYESFTSYERGDMPLLTMTVVGASAATSFTSIAKATLPLSRVRNSNKSKTKSSSSSTAKNNPNPAQPTTSAAASTILAATDFRLVTEQGTHVYCQTATPGCRSVWLSAFQSALELEWELSSMTDKSTLDSSQDAASTTTTTITKKWNFTTPKKPSALSIVSPELASIIMSQIQPSKNMKPPPVPSVCKEKLSSKYQNTSLFKSLVAGGSTTKLPKYCVSCGKVELTAITTAATTNAPSYENNDGLYDVTSVSPKSTSSSSHISRAEVLSPNSSPSPQQQHNRGISYATLSNSITTPLFQYDKETRCDVCFHCSVAQGVVQYMQFCTALLQHRLVEQHALRAASKACWKVIYETSIQQQNQYDELKQKYNQSVMLEDDNEDDNDVIANNDKDKDKDHDTNGETNDTNGVDCKIKTPSATKKVLTFDEYFVQRWKIPLPENATTTLIALVQISSTEFGMLKRQSTILESVQNDFLNRCNMSVAEFLELLDELAGFDIFNEEKNALSALKKQAFLIAGDMGTAMKLFLELALPHDGWSSRHNNYSTSSSASTSSSSFTDSHHHGGGGGGNDNPSSNGSSNAGGNNSVGSTMTTHNSASIVSSSTHQSSSKQLSNNPYDTEMLSCVIEFFLDLCERGDLPTIAFFWPQLCHIHLRMLPAKNALDLARIDIVEDFLLTVCTQYSIHLALELTWYHTADLEESLALSGHGSGGINTVNGSGTSTNSTINTSHNEGMSSSASISPKCRQRRFAVVRFLCELESLLFDEAGTRWGCTNTRTTSSRKFVGGSGVALGTILSPTPHQVELLQQAATNMERLRNEIYNTSPQSPSSIDGIGGFIHTASTTSCSTTSTSTSLSSMHETLRRGGTRTSLYRHRPHDPIALPPEQQVAAKLRIAKNADYFTCHLSFSKRLADIAERLRFIDLDKRADLLREELDLLNSSGTMGGDPLNRISTTPDGLIRVVRIPSTEGHVFRSKERTPVLLLMEVIDESAEFETETTQEPNLVSSDEQQQQQHQENGTILSSRLMASENDSEEIDTLNVESINESLEQTSISKIGTDSATETGDDIPVVQDTKNLNESEKFYDAVDDDDDDDIKQQQYLQQDQQSLRNVELTPARDCRSFSDSMDLLEGASSGNRPSPRPGALKRFDDKMPVTPKRDVEILVSHVVGSQLHEIDVPDLGVPQPFKEQATTLSTVTSMGSMEDFPDDSFDMVAAKSSPRSKSEGASQLSSSLEVPRSSKRLGAIAVGPSSDSGESCNALFAPTGDPRREVLTTIMMRGIQGNTIAAGAQDSVQRTLKELGRKRATELLLKDDDDTALASSPEKDKHDPTKVTKFSSTDSTKQKMELLGLSPISSTEDDELAARPTEEDEIMEAIRLILIQYRVAQGLLSPADAAKVLQHTSLSPSNYNASARRRKDSTGTPHVYDASDHPTIDAGDVDPRLVGCGPLPPAILQAMTLWKAEMVSHAELLELVKKDIEFVKHSVLVDAESIDKLKENSAFWGRFAFGERWAEKKSRIQSSSPQGSIPGWDLLGVIIKSNDDLRQEAFIMQLIELCKEAFELAGLELWISPYRILATGRSTGVIECVRNAMSFDSLKKRPGYGKGGLREHLLRMTEFTADPGESFKTAQRNFVRSLAAYSLLSYFFMFKDRHNGNLLLDTAGHVIHIDFGFVFGIAPGGSFSLEMSTPFKLTEEMLDVMGGLRSPLFSEFVTLFCCGFLTLQSYCDTFLTIVEITCTDSTFKCFDGRSTNEVVSKLRERFCPDLNKEETVSFALDLIKQATTSYGTRQYDIFQYLSQGIVS